MKASEAVRWRLYRVESEGEFKGQLVLCFKDGHLITNSGHILTGHWEICDLCKQAVWTTVGPYPYARHEPEVCSQSCQAQENLCKHKTCCQPPDRSPWCFPACTLPCACSP